MAARDDRGLLLGWGPGAEDVWAFLQRLGSGGEDAWAFIGVHATKMLELAAGCVCRGTDVVPDELPALLRCGNGCGAEAG